jgi:hypothetical protein
MKQISTIVNSPTLQNDKKAGIVQDLFKAQPEVMADVERIISKRRSW